MHYFIDGYNLMFRVLRAGDDLESQRKTIIHDLQKKINFLNLNATLVFDAQHQDTDISRSHLERLEILFTNRGETADEYIVQALKEDTSNEMHTVVTSDKKLAWLARRKRAKTETVEEFISWLNRRYKKNLLEKRKIKKLETTLATSAPGISKPSSPALNSLPEECFGFYLDQFETAYHELEKEKAVAKSKKTTAAKKPRTPKKPKKTTFPEMEEQQTLDDEHSSMQRWLKIFEGRSTKSF